MQELARSGKTILYSSHVLEAVEKVCSRVMIIYHGRLIADNSVERAAADHGRTLTGTGVRRIGAADRHRNCGARNN